MSVPALPRDVPRHGLRLSNKPDPEVTNG